MGIVMLTEEKVCARVTRRRRREPAKEYKRAVKTQAD